MADTTQQTGRGVDEWVADLEARHLADLTTTEVARALRALSVTYVEQRGRLTRGAALDGAGKRAAFALFYGPLHYLVTRHIVTALGATDGPAGRLYDLGCGTGAVGAAWAGACVCPPAVSGFDRHPWAVDEARRTYRAFGLTGEARRTDVLRFDWARRPERVVAGYLLNELERDARWAVLEHLRTWAAAGTAVLIIEPIARTIAPWMPRFAESAEGRGWRHDEWRVEVQAPKIVRHLEAAAGLDQQIVTARTLYWAGAVPPGSTT